MNKLIVEDVVRRGSEDKLMSGCTAKADEEWYGAMRACISSLLANLSFAVHKVMLV